ncbi:HAD-IA family hydrolase [Candidatus Nephthysia bennettiae]|uniref:HAD-IA family hydrolase n=1 Tax=Candidatus Nephthysia bennettiae TaxID=3127016 RepID=A0A934K6S6_9BACT|nr:HAD-IA family hydrolase [Candidatus Dormibacteraeota bacterium]MBJ7614666.1 HAD-IA family hydrolase [Candidatus Dormibacteraeota bacterium]
MRALVFDFDGLIIDTEGPVYEAWAEVYRKHGQELSLEFWKTIVGRGSNYFDPIAELEVRLGRSLEGEAIRAERRLRTLELVEALTILPGVIEWRKEAKALGVRLGVASSSGRGWVTGHLERLGLAGWDCIRCLEDVDNPKPAADLYLSVLECLGVPPQQAVAVEDSVHGVEAAKTAGLYCVAVPSSLTADHDFSRADLVLSSLSERSFGEVGVLAGGGGRRR